MTTVSVLMLAFLALVAALAAAGFWVAYKFLLGLGWLLKNLVVGVALLLRHVFRFVRGTLVGVVHMVGAFVTALAIVPLALVNFLIGRWPAARHYGRAIEDELVSGLLGAYRVAIGQPLRLVGLGALVDGLERRLPDLVDRAPRRVRKKGPGFEGYDLVRAMPTGGSGAQLYLARPRPETVARVAREGRELPGEVVIKSFELEQGSTLPQIVRESRALEAAGRLGLVYEHHLDAERFYYVMRFVRGDELDTVIHRLHARSSPAGLGDRELAEAVGYTQDLLRTLERFHAGGLWHKDVKPANIIVSEGRAHLVDFGLVTPLYSAMTLTTHGTEFYRDPEMVKLALQGVKVHEVDGVKFDVYSAGAVLYALVEDSFPAHGSLSRITRRSPEALQWIIRRAMAEMGSRYGSAGEMLDDLAALASASDPFALVPANLPSFRGGAADPSMNSPLERVETDEATLAGGASDLGEDDFVPYAKRMRGQRSGPRRAFTPPAPAPAPATLAADPAAVRRGRRRRGLAAAAAFVLCFVAIRSTVEALGHEHAQETVARWERLTNPLDRNALRLAEDIVEDSSFDDELTRRWARHVEPLLPEPEERASRSERTDVVLDGGRVLVLDDLSNGAEPDALLALSRVLERRGFDVLEERATEEESDVSLFAGARHAVGLADPDDAEALGSLQAYLDDSEGLDAIVWIARSPAEECHLFRLVVRRAPEPAQRIALGSPEGQ